MFNVTLLRNEQAQEIIEVMVLNPHDERFFKRNGIQIDMEDKTFNIVLKAKLADGRVVEQSKNTLSIPEVFSALANACKKVLNTPKVVH